MIPRANALIYKDGANNIGAGYPAFVLIHVPDIRLKSDTEFNICI